MYIDNLLLEDIRYYKHNSKRNCNSKCWFIKLLIYYTSPFCDYVCTYVALVMRPMEGFLLSPFRTLALLYKKGK